MSDLISRKEFIKKSSGAVIPVGLAGRFFNNAY